MGIETSRVRCPGCVSRMCVGETKDERTRSQHEPGAAGEDDRSRRFASRVHVARNSNGRMFGAIRLGAGAGAVGCAIMSSLCAVHPSVYPTDAKKSGKCVIAQGSLRSVLPRRGSIDGGQRTRMLKHRDADQALLLQQPGVGSVERAESRYQKSL